MEQAQPQFWSLKSHFQAPMNSWEEKTFAEDAGGCIWPPTSYTCSFCSREFRSAQALGGHMNIHRRERTELKQSHTSDNGIPIPLKSSDPKFRHRPYGFESSSSVSRVSALSGTCSIVRGQHKGQVFGPDSTAKTTRIVSSFDDRCDEATGCKRRKIAASALPFLVVGVKPGSIMEDLDLELRL